MQKISYKLLDKVLERCSKKEIDFILYSAQFQNEFGNVRDINYKYACLHLHVSKQGFYNILRSLETKKIIVINWLNTEKDWSFTFIENQFLDYKDTSKGYLKTNFYFLHDLDFMNLDLRSKRLILKLLKSYRPDQQFKIGMEKLREWIGCQDLDQYIEVIKMYFNIVIDFRGMMTIKLKRYNQRYTDSDLYKTIHHKLTNFCSKYRIAYTTADLREMYFIFSDDNKKRQSKFNQIVLAICNTVFKYKSIEPGLIKSIIS